METEQNEIIRNCLMQEYSVGGVAGMGELLAEANGIGQEYAALINQLSRCSNVIIAGIDGSGYFSPETGAYKQFNIKIGQIETAQVHDALLGFVLPYVVQAWLRNDNYAPLELHFVSHIRPYWWSAEHRLEADYIQFKIATSLKNHIKKCLIWLKSDWSILLHINNAFGKIVLPKFQ